MSTGVLLFDASLTRADTIIIGSPTTALHFGSDGTTIYLALLSGDLMRVGRMTGSIVQRQRITDDSVSALWQLRSGHTIVAVAGTALHFLPADLSHSGRRIETCDDSITALSAFGVLGRAYVTCGVSTLVEIDSRLEIVVRSTSLSSDSTTPDICGTAGVATSHSAPSRYPSRGATAPCGRGPARGRGPP